MRDRIWRIGGIGMLCLSWSLTMLADDIGPQWQVGDQWSIETQTVQSQASHNTKQRGAVEWSFAVVGKEKIGEEDCFRVEITCADTRRLQPNVTIWVSQNTGMLIRLTSRIPVDGTYREYTESYAMVDGVPTPVLGILPALPLDLPIFSRAARNSKSLEPMVYESISGNGKTKALNDIRFAYSVTQTMTAVPPNRMKSLDRSADVAQSVQVRIAAGRRNVEQVWAPNKPWPVYSTNGTSVSRLKKFVPVETEESE